MAVPAGLRQVRWEQKVYWRNPAAAAFTFAFPLMFLIIFNAIYGNNTVHLKGGPARFAQYYVPAIAAFGVISACYTNLAFTLCVRRENGMLKRARGTPLSPVAYLAGIIGSVVIVSVILTILTTVLGVAVYSVRFPDRYLGLVVTVAVAAFCFSAVGVAISTFVPNEDAAPAIINFVLFPLLFISGTFGQISETSVLTTIAKLFPVWHLIQQMVAVFDPYTSGSGLVARDLGAMLAWGVAGVAVSVRRFRWEPRRV